jgi:hypothetical protein
MRFSRAPEVVGRKVVAIASVVGLVILGLADPNTNPMFPPCLFRATTGWLCPGCGAARAIHALLHGNFRTAIEMNVSAVLALPLVAIDFVQGWGDTGGGWLSRLPPPYVWALVACVTAFGILRNVLG